MIPPKILTKVALYFTGKKRRSISRLAWLSTVQLPLFRAREPRAGCGVVLLLSSFPWTGVIFLFLFGGYEKAICGLRLTGAPPLQSPAFHRAGSAFFVLPTTRECGFELVVLFCSVTHPVSLIQIMGIITVNLGTLDTAHNYWKSPN